MWENVSWMLGVLVIDMLTVLTQSGFEDAQWTPNHNTKSTQPGYFSHCYNILTTAEAWLLSTFNYCVCAAEVRNELVLKSESVSDTFLDPSQWSSPRGVPLEATRGERGY